MRRRNSGWAEIGSEIGGGERTRQVERGRYVRVLSRSRRQAAGGRGDWLRDKGPGHTIEPFTPGSVNRMGVILRSQQAGQID